MSKMYQKIIQKRGFRELPYQKDFLTNPIYDSPINPLVLAAGTSSGKSFMSIMHEEIFYSNPANKNKRTLYIPSSRTVLRDNIAKELEDFNPSFTYCVATNKAELLQAIKSKCNVIVALPQTLIGSIDILPKFHNFILDEAHQWYFKSTIQNIIKKVSPKYQLLLTGTPSRFIAKGDKFEFKFVSVMELFDLKKVTNVKVEVVSSSYDFKQSDYLSAYGNLKDSVKMTTKESDNALMVVCREMIKKLKNPIKGLHNVNRLSKNLFSIFGEIDKTIIFCHSKKQANTFYNSLNSFKGLKNKVLVSHSENDKDSILFEQFRNDSDIKVLIAVDRGRLGYNMPELFNIVDFTMTQSLDMLLQMYGRLLRQSVLQPNKQKIYYKVATKNTAPYFVDLMTAMLCLTNMEWYSKFNGKNMGGILIPKVLNNTKKKTKSNSITSKSKSTKPSISLADLDIPLDLNLFKQSALHTNDDGFATIAWTTLDDVRREFFNIRQGNTCWEYDTIKKEILKYNSSMEFIRGGKDNANYYQYARKKGWLELFSHFDSKTKEITKQDIIKSANQYNDYEIWGKECANIRAKAIRIGVIDEVTSHMKKRNNSNGLTKKQCLEVALQYNKRDDFKKNDSYIHSYARKMGWYNDITKHMIYGLNRNDKQKRKVIQKDLNGKIIKIWDSMSDAQRQYNSSIQKALYKKQASALGYIWEYEKN
jgi:superfamily II DNA or RNA helicase